MPFVHARIISTDEDPQFLHRLQAELARLAFTPLGKAADVTSVLVERANTDSWRIGGSAATTAAHVTISVTAGTNTVDEKAAFVAQTYAMLRELFGEGLSEATYVVVNEVDGDSWGYGGITAAERRRASTAT